MVGRLAAVALALASVLAGCAGAPADESGGEPLEVAHGKGAIRGLVVDEAVRPLGGVTLTLPRTAANVQSGTDGLFAFTDLEPGFYVLEASLPGYDATQLQVEVAAGEDPPVTKLVLVATPALQPYVESYVQTMFATFRSQLIGLGTIFDQAIGQGMPGFYGGLTPTATIVVGELTWDATTPLAEEVGLTGVAFVRQPDGTTETVSFANAEGPSSLLVRFNATQELTGNQFLVRIDTVVWKVDQPTSPPPNPSGSAHVNQKYQGFAHVFHNFVPREEWSFVQDGPYPLLR